MEHKCEENVDLDGSYDFEGEYVFFYGYCNLCSKKLLKSYRESEVSIQKY